MMFLLFLLPLVTAVPLKSQESYKIEVEDGVLKNILLLGDITSELDISSKGLVNLKKEAFDNVLHLKSLNLANNSLAELPDFVFSNLTVLEHLNLAQNQLDEVKYLFVGLETLKTLNISHNPMLHLRRGHFFGLTRNTDIFTEGNCFWSISTGVFENSFLKEDEEKMKDIETMTATNKPTDDEKDSDMNSLSQKMKKTSTTKEPEKKVKSSNGHMKLKLCEDNDIVVSLEVLKEDEKVNENCSVVSFNKQENEVLLRSLGIKGFQKGWYRLDTAIDTINLSDNEITEITKDTLNDLPEGVTYVNLNGNKIRKISKDVIENEYLMKLNFKGNLLENIEENAFVKTKLIGLYLSDNQMQTLDFVASLPVTLTQFIITNNPVTSIPDGAFSRFSKLLYLNMAGNKIERLQDNVFSGLESLEALVLTRNNIKEVGPKAFYGLKSLTTLYIYRNFIEDIKQGTFADLEKLRQLDLSRNKLRQVTKDMFADLPKELEDLHLDNNEIESLEEGSFNQVPLKVLSFDNNKLTNIPKGVFDLPHVGDLYLNKNLFETIEGDSFEGMPRLRHLWLSGNKISRIEKGACKNLGNLYVLDISRNPFERLENGALHGLPTILGTYIYIYENQLKLMQGGLFDDV